MADNEEIHVFGLVGNGGKNFFYLQSASNEIYRIYITKTLQEQWQGTNLVGKLVKVTGFLGINKLDKAESPEEQINAFGIRELPSLEEMVTILDNYRRKEIIIQEQVKTISADLQKILPEAPEA